MTGSSRDIAYTILAGGLNTRYGGKTKATEKVGGEEIIGRITRELKPLGGEIIIVTNTPEKFSGYSSFSLVSDIFKKAGPLGGIHAAMSNSDSDAFFVIAGDMPFIDSKLLLEQIEVFRTRGCEVLIPLLNGFIEPLHGIYSASISGRLTSFLEKSQKMSIREFLKEVDTSYWEPGDKVSFRRAVVNINTPGDLRLVENLYLDRG